MTARALVSIAGLVLLLLAGRAVAQNTAFVAVALHDIADRLADAPAEQRGDAVSTDRLVVWLDWLRGNGWTTVSLDDVVAAQRGTRALPERAILLTVDDGHASLYTRLYPLALAMRMPIVAAIQTGWLDVPAGQPVRYGDVDVPRERFITWAQAREMQASGWIEFATHGHGLHRGVPMAPQGSTAPAAAARQWRSDGRYESEAEQRERIRADLEQSVATLRRELGRAPRALAWPFGAHTALAREAAAAAGLSLLLTLDPEPADARRPEALARYLPIADPRLGELVEAMRFADPLPAATRLMCVDLAALSGPDSEARLGAAIEAVARVAPTHVVLDALGADGRAWFANDAGVPATDLLPRVSRQLETRAGVRVVVRLDATAARAAAGGDEHRALALFTALGAQVRPAALWIGDAHWPLRGGAVAAAPWQVRVQRDTIDPATLDAGDAFSLRAFRAVQRSRDDLQAVWLAPPGVEAPGAAADLTLLHTEAAWTPTPPPGDLPAMRRIGRWWPAAPAAVEADARALQVAGGAVLGWCGGTPEDALRAAPTLGARRRLTDGSRP